MCPLRHASSALAVAVLLFAVGLGTPRAASPVADAAQGDFAGLVDIGGGRRLYIERRGSGSPAVVLEAGYRSSARIWSEDLHQSGAPPMALASVAAFTRGCAYDRPGRRRSSTTTSARAAATPSPCRGPPLDAAADLQHCSAPHAFSSQALAGRPLCPALRQHLPVTSSGSSSSTPSLRRSKRC